MPLKDRILTILSVYGINQSEFAQRIGVSKGAVSHIMSEGGRQGSFKPETVNRIVNAFPGVTYNWLMNGNGDGPVASPQTQPYQSVQRTTNQTLNQISGQGEPPLTPHKPTDELNLGGNTERNSLVNPQLGNGNLFDIPVNKADFTVNTPIKPTKIGYTDSVNNISTVNQQNCILNQQNGLLNPHNEMQAEVFNNGLQAEQIANPTAHIAAASDTDNEPKASKVVRVVMFFADGTFKDYIPA